MTITSIKVPERFLENGYAFVDGGTGPGQVGPSIQFDERALPELYRIMSDPIMLRRVQLGKVEFDASTREVVVNLIVFSHNAFAKLTERS